jgi:cis-3-alkyl-4-acyloxetan-2-one decarboxylase
VEESLGALERKPLLLCWGMRDWCFTPAFLKEWQRRFTKAEVETVENAGHYLLEDEGARVVVRIQAFLRPVADAR